MPVTRQAGGRNGSNVAQTEHTHSHWLTSMKMRKVQSRFSPPIEVPKVVRALLRVVQASLVKMVYARTAPTHCCTRDAIDEPTLRMAACGGPRNVNVAIR